MLLTMCGKRESHTASDICRPHVLKQVAIISTGLDELECIRGLHPCEVRRKPIGHRLAYRALAVARGPCRGACSTVRCPAQRPIVPGDVRDLMKGITSALELPHDSGHPFVSRRLVGHRAPSTARSTENEEKERVRREERRRENFLSRKTCGGGVGGVRGGRPDSKCTRSHVCCLGPVCAPALSPVPPLPV